MTKIYAIIGVFVLTIVGYQHFKISSLENEVEKLSSNVVVLESNNYKLNSELKYQNDIIETQKVDLKERLKKLRELENKEPEVRFKTIYKETPNLKDKSNECKNIKNLLDSIRTNGF